MARSTEELLRWDDSPGLKHHCGVCKMPLANPNAMQSCIGEHVEPCERYHQQLHFIRKSHDCSSCHTAVEMHRKRHREILVILDLVKEEDCKTKPARLNETRPAENTTPSTRKMKKKLKKSVMKGSRVCTSDIFTEANYAFVSKALYDTTIWGKSAAINSPNNADGDSTLDSTRLHSPSPGSQTGHKAKSSDNPWPHEKSFRRSSSGPRSPTTNPLFAIDQKIFKRLGLDLTGMQSWSKKRKDLLKKLAVVISEDIETTEREDQETKIRKAAFFRYVTKRALNNLNELHEQFSWSTGEIIKHPKT